MTTRTLLPCPFCGAQPNEPVTSGGSDERCGYNFTVSIECKCGVVMLQNSRSDKNGWCNDKGEAKAAVIKAWNNRNGSALYVVQSVINKGE